MWSLKSMKRMSMLTKTFKMRQTVNFSAVKCMSTLIQRQIELEKTKIPDRLKTSDGLTSRHLGVDEVDQQQMLSAIGCKSIEEMLDQAVPSSILETKLSDMFKHKTADIGQIRSESLYLENLKEMASKNKIMTCYQGQGFHPCLTPNVILRNVLENPNWYTPYTPYQAEIAQGRLESLLNFQTMITDLTGMDISNASLLCEATAAAESMYMCFSHFNKKRSKFFVSKNTFRHVIEVIKTRAEFLDIKVEIGDPNQIDFSINEDYCGVLVQNPDIHGNITDWQNKAEEVHKSNTFFVIGADILSLPITKSPGEMGADISYGLTQRFGVPMGYGGPHAAFFAVKHDHRYRMPGRVIGVSQDAYGGRALRMAMQTREQHIRRDRATSNICTAQALLANMAAFYGVWHGPKGLINIAERVNHQAHILHDSLTDIGYKLVTEKGRMFDTISIDVSHEANNIEKIIERFEKEGINIGAIDHKHISVSLNETTTLAELEKLIQVFGDLKKKEVKVKFEDSKYNGLDDTLKRQSKFMEHEIFNSIKSETDMMRYIQKLADKDIGLTKSMIPLGSCTMKLNAAVEMIPVSWPEFANIHPFAPQHQTQGYAEMIKELSESLMATTGFDAISMQPNSGASGEYAGLLTIRNFHKANGENHRDVCLIPQSAHGTNPATAHMLGMKIVVIKTDEHGN